MSIATITDEQIFPVHHDDHSLIIVVEYADVRISTNGDVGRRCGCA